MIFLRGQLGLLMGSQRRVEPSISVKRKATVPVG
jgi:hypothetical protein